MIRRLSLVTFAGVALLLAPLCPASLAADREVVNGIAAVVNADVITYSQVRDLTEPREKLLRSQFSGEELAQKIKEARQSVLKDLIDRQLIIQAFNKESYQIPDHYVDQQIDAVIREAFGGDRNTFVKTLQAQNYTLTEFKKMEKEKMIVQAMRGKNLKRNTLIPPAKVGEYYAQHRTDFTSKEQVKLRMIMIPGSASEGNAASQKSMAEEILGKLAGGAEFERIAQMYSEDSTRDLGGDWGWIERNTLAAPLEKVAFNLPTGKMSNIIELAGNYYILRVDEKRGGDSKSLAEVRPEIEKRLMQEEAQRQQELWLASLRQKAYIRTF